MSVIIAETCLESLSEAVSLHLNLHVPSELDGGLAILLTIYDLISVNVCLSLLRCAGC